MYKSLSFLLFIYSYIDVLIAILYLDLIQLNNLIKGDKGDTGSLQSLNQHVASSDNVLKSLEGRVGLVENKLETVIEQESTIIKFLNSLTLVLDEKLPK